MFNTALDTAKCCKRGAIIVCLSLVAACGGSGGGNDGDPEDISDSNPGSVEGAEAQLLRGIDRAGNLSALVTSIQDVRSSIDNFRGAEDVAPATAA